MYRLDSHESMGVGRSVRDFAPEDATGRGVSCRVNLRGGPVPGGLQIMHGVNAKRECDSPDIVEPHPLAFCYQISLPSMRNDR